LNFVEVPADNMNVSNKSPLQKQLDHQKFLHAVDYVRKESQSIKKLSTTELSRINSFLSGISDEPWRFDPVQVQIPGGTLHKMNMLSNPINRARELVGNALQMSGNGQGLEAATFLYSQLVLDHLFQQANRRTAVAAALWILLLSGYDCDAEKFLNIPIGDLRNRADLDSLRTKIESIIRKT
jgi:hypothetical protein